LPYWPIYTGLSGESSSWLPTTSTKGEAIKKVYTTTLWEEKEVHRIFGIPPSWWHCQHTLLRNHALYHIISIIVTYQTYASIQILPLQKGRIQTCSIHRKHAITLIREPRWEYTNIDKIHCKQIVHNILYMSHYDFYH
jgi:hypothetical protein